MSHFLNRSFVKYNFGIACTSNWAIYSFWGGRFEEEFVTESILLLLQHVKTSAGHTQKNVGKKDISHVLPNVYVQINRSYSPTIFFVRSKTTPV